MSVRTVPGALDILNQKLGGNAGDIPASSTKEYALEKIYRTLGGEETLEGVNTTSEIIEKIAGVAEGGGGGSSDFSTANVTLVTAEGSVWAPIKSINFFDNNECSRAEPMNAEETYTIILYKGQFLAFVDSPEDYYIEKVSGAVEIIDYEGVTGFAAVITGDCAINIKVRT